MRNCYDEGILQGYLDGELSPVMMDEVGAHLALCDACAGALVEAESEMAMFSTTLEHDFAIPVPSERLRERLDAALADSARQETPHTISLRLREFFSTLIASLNFAPRQAMAFASLIAVVAFAAVMFAVLRQNPVSQMKDGQSEIASVTNTPRQDATRPDATTIPNNQAGTTADVINSNIDRTSETSGVTAKDESKGVRFVNAGLRTPRRNTPVRANRTPEAKGTNAKEDALLPGEESYLNAIASLSKVIEAGGDAVLRPALRAEYERNLSVVDQAILATRQNALRNPKDDDSVKFLMSAYQSKVELLTAVADQAQIAVLGR